MNTADIRSKITYINGLKDILRHHGCGIEELAKKITEAASYFDIKVLDHIIVSEEGYYSFADEGLL